MPPRSAGKVAPKAKPPPKPPKSNPPPKQQLPPAIATRDKNKDTHPASHAVLGTTRRRTPAEMAEVKRAKLEQEAQKREALEHAARLEDELRREDIEMDEIANHPPKQKIASFRPPPPKDVLNKGMRIF